MTPALLGNYVEKQRENGKKDRFQVSSDMMKSCLVNYRKSVKAARTKYFADIISRNSHSPKIVFDTINTALNPAAAATVCYVPNRVTCNEFLNFFSPPTNDHAIVLCCPEFEPVFLVHVKDIVSHTKLTTCPLDIVPT